MREKDNGVCVGNLSKTGKPREKNGKIPFQTLFGKYLTELTIVPDYSSQKLLPEFTSICDAVFQEVERKFDAYLT
jgi:hypothetical protein